MLADAFAAGQTHLIDPPAKELMALRDPYDARANQNLRLHDAILFDGKYYLYWGPVPAALLTPLRMTGFGYGSDRLLLVIFTEAMMVLLALTLLTLRRRHFPDAGVWPIVACAFAAGLCSAVPFLFARPSVYEAAIMAGQCFLIAAILCSLRGWWIAAGVCAALAAGSRLNLGPCIAALIALTLWELHRRGAPRRQLVITATKLATPLVLMVAALAIYNHARFGSFRESGVRYMLASRSARMALASGRTFSFEYVTQNAKNYLIAPFEWRASVAFAAPRRDFQPAGAPKLFRSDVVAGLLAAAPVFLLALIPMSGRPVWALVAIAAAMAPLLGFFYGSMRYLADVTPMLAILSAVGMMRLRRKRLFVVAAAALLVYSCAVGVSLAAWGYS
jgi:hypothetical protein